MLLVHFSFYVTLNYYVDNMLSVNTYIYEYLEGQQKALINPVCPFKDIEQFQVKGYNLKAPLHPLLLKSVTMESRCVKLHYQHITLWH